MRDAGAIGEDLQALAPAIFRAGFIPQDGQRVAMIGNMVEAEPIPRAVLHQRVDLDHLIGPWPQAYQTGDDQVAVGGMVVILAAFAPDFIRLALCGQFVIALFAECSCDPLAGERIQVFVDLRHDAPVVEFPALGMGIGLQDFEVVLLADGCLPVVV